MNYQHDPEHHAEICALCGCLQAGHRDILARMGIDLILGCTAHAVAVDGIVHMVDMGLAQVIWERLSDEQRGILRLYSEERREAIEVHGERVIALMGVEYHSRRPSVRRRAQITSALRNPQIRGYVSRRLSDAQVL